MTENRFNFRAFIKPLNKIYRVYNLMENGDKVEVIDNNGDFVGDGFYKDEFNLMQSTCLTDKNNIEIFEGDIIKINKNSKAIIEFKNSGFFIVEKGYNNQLLNNFVNYKVIEVVGNIYENQELLKS